MIKTKVSMLLCLIMIFSSVLPVYAADDAVGLSYKTDILAYDEKNVSKTTFQRGDKIRVDIVLDNTGVASAPLYALQGKLTYDIGCLSAVSVKNSQNVLSSLNAGLVSFSFLDKSTTGVKVSDPFIVASVMFEAIQDGSTNLMFTQFDVTNADGSKRSVDYSAIKTIKVGTGIRTEDKPALNSLIQKCSNEISNVIVSPDGDAISKNSFWVTQTVYDKLKAVITASEAVYNNQVASTSDISQAMKNLDIALMEFFANRAYGSKSNNVVIDYENDKVTVIATASDHGKIAEKSLKQVVYKNTSVTIVSIPDLGYEVDKVYVNGKEFDGNENFTISKVTNDTVVKVTFCWKNVFTDVKKDDWFYSCVMLANKNGLMNGITANKFAPKANITRGMFVTVLYRIENEPTSALAKFSDVNANQYYSNAVGWANANGIVKGITQTQFAPNQNITREQMAVILYRYAKFKGVDLSVSGSTKYSDNGNIADYAKDAVVWLAEKGIMLGNANGNFEPKKNSNRAEAAAVFTRIVENLK